MPRVTHAAAPRHLTPPAIAARLGVAEETVRAWIVAGELPAADVARRGCRRPRYRVDPADLAAFLAARRPDAPPAAKKTQRRTKETGIIQFY